MIFLKTLASKSFCQRGPLSHSRMLELVGDIDALLCGDDEITADVIDKALPRLKVFLIWDRFGQNRYRTLGKPKNSSNFCPGVNHTTVAEHTFALMLGLFRHLVMEANHVSTRIGSG